MKIIEAKNNPPTANSPIRYPNRFRPTNGLAKIIENSTKSHNIQLTIMMYFFGIEDIN